MIRFWKVNLKTIKVVNIINKYVLKPYDLSQSLKLFALSQQSEISLMQALHSNMVCEDAPFKGCQCSQRLLLFTCFETDLEFEVWICGKMQEGHAGL